MIWSPELRLASTSLRSRLNTRPPGPYGWSTSSKCGLVRSSSAASTVIRARSRTSAALRSRRSSRCRAKASASPTSRPSIAPVARLSIAFGLVGFSGTRASLMMLPAATVVVVSSFIRPVSELSWFCELLRRLSRLLRSELPSLESASRLLIPVSATVSCPTFRRQRPDPLVQPGAGGLLTVAQVRLGERVRAGLRGPRACRPRTGRPGRWCSPAPRPTRRGPAPAGAPPSAAARRPCRDRAGADQLGLGVEVDRALGPAAGLVGVLVHRLHQHRGGRLVDLGHRVGDRGAQPQAGRGDEQHDPPVPAEHAEVVREVGGAGRVASIGSAALSKGGVSCGFRAFRPTGVNGRAAGT